MNANGIGGSNAAIELAKLSDMSNDIQPISKREFAQRVEKAQLIMRERGIDACYLNAGTNLYYFTGTRWYASERMVGAILPANGDIEYIAPHFEIDTLEQFMVLKGKIHPWHEHQSPYQTVNRALSEMGIHQGKLAIDESSQFFISNGIQLACPELQLIDAKPITAGCRMQKSSAELALLQRAKDMTLAVHKAAARILREGISSQEVEAFINEAHKRVGASSGSYFCIVLFGQDTAFPHGVSNPKTLDKNDMVLIDTGCQLHGYNSDITRSYVFGQATPKQRQVWQHEKQAQLEAFAAAQINAPCAQVDRAARDYLVAQGYGPEYNLPGLPHRTGHGIGLDIHEWPYLVASEQTALANGMCFSNEPMLCIPGEFGVRLEDHFYMTDDGPKWFTEPAHSVDDPFAYMTQ
ncbi:Xaa-Pro peptidase family protein [Thalassotalea ponticola]|uniref:M24 family metallopeptidase n=1 Tax=Thalassotalea ponticola TaxID=1523392 RepID=UPI0025B5197A|nr:Xaa-Pro peptidase family protein [Thalassotalea ponticola]MDN3651256.1 Xaa-Pro peptidase family protein [Thalassotalea ponticola]